jgi:penicillin-binding protein 1A
MALPIVGEFLKKSYDDPRLGLSRNAKFSRPEGWVSYDCPKEMAPSEGEVQQSTEPDEFFGL